MVWQRCIKPTCSHPLTVVCPYWAVMDDKSVQSKGNDTSKAPTHPQTAPQTGERLRSTAQPGSKHIKPALSTKTPAPTSRPATASAFAPTSASAPHRPPQARSKGIPQPAEDDPDGPWEDIDLREPADDPDFTFVQHDDAGHSAENARRDIASRYPPETDDQLYQHARDEMSGEGEDFEQVRGGKNAPSSRAGQGDRADK